MSGDESNEEPARRVGMVLARKYKLRRLLGVGGMGAVYDALNEWTGRRVAVKVMHRAMTHNSEAVARFMREARAATSVAHPNIIEVLDLGEDQTEDVMFLVTEFLEGKDLRWLLEKRGKLPLAIAIEMLSPIMAALVCAHRRGVVHRDLKPENIFLVQDASGKLHPKLIDFGIAKMEDPSGRGLTRAGAVMGTPQYMAPEQARGETQIDSRADVWAIAAVLFELIAGVPVFDGDNALQIVAKILTAPVPRLDALVKDVPSAFADVIAHALERNLEQRCPSVSLFLWELIETATTLGPAWQTSSRKWFEQQIETIDRTPLQPHSTGTFPTADTIASAPAPMRSHELASEWQLAHIAPEALLHTPPQEMVSSSPLIPVPPALTAPPPQTTPVAPTAPAPSKLPWLLAAALLSLVFIAVGLWRLRPSPTTNPPAIDAGTHTTAIAVDVVTIPPVLTPDVFVVDVVHHIDAHTETPDVATQPITPRIRRRIDPPPNNDNNRIRIRRNYP